jgi:Protein of unknown function (DUF2911)
MKKIRRPSSFIVILLLLGCCCIISCNTEKKTDSVNPPAISKQVMEPANPYAVIDKSPVDISYYPVNYPKQLMEGNDSATLTARVIYSRPHKMGRTILSSDPASKSIQQYGAYWRLGANEATEIEFFKPVSIQGHAVARGRYIIYCIPFQDKWTIVLNANLFSFGLHQDTAKDLMKFEIPVQKTTDDIEYFTMVFQKTASGADLIMAWGDIKAALPIRF